MSERYWVNQYGATERDDGLVMLGNHATTKELNAQAARIAALEAEAAEWRRRAEQAEAERDALLLNWPEFSEGGNVPASCIDYTDGEWFVGDGLGRTGYPTREAAVRAAAGISRAGQAGGEGTT